MGSIFISHAHDDAALALGLANALRAVLPNDMTVEVSSERSASGGIEPGQSWPQWIQGRVVTASDTLVVMTPRSIVKPWVLWEVGAVMGVAAAQARSESAIPVLYRVSADRLPAMLGHIQAVKGDDPADIANLLQRMARAYLKNVPDRAIDLLVSGAVDAYLPGIEVALRDVPPPLDEPAVQEWVGRVDLLVAARRASEVDHLRRGVEIAFGGVRDGVRLPLDVRLHRRFGDIYLDLRRPQEAVEQFALAAALAPRDIFVRHKLALANLENGNEPEAQKQLQLILGLDATILDWNAEIAGLNARMHRERYKRSGDRADLRLARDALLKASATDPSSYYLADLVGQYSLLLGERQPALDAFAVAEAAVARLGNPPFWALTSAASAALALRGVAEGVVAVERALATGPARRDAASFREGITRVAAGLALSPAETTALLTPFERLGG